MEKLFYSKKKFFLLLEILESMIGLYGEFIRNQLSKDRRNLSEIDDI